MQRFKDGYKNNPLALPTFWTDPTNGHKIYWNSNQYWLAFMQVVNDYCAGNGKEAPAESEVENQICKQLPKWVCDGEPAPAFPAGSQGAQVSSAQSCCGRRA